MRILYIAGEAANWVVNLCNEFCRKGHEVVCVVQQLDEYDSENPVPEHENLTRVNVDHDVMFSPYDLKKELSERGLFNSSYDLLFGAHAPNAPALSEFSEELGVPWGVMVLDILTDLFTVQPYRRIQWSYWLSKMSTAKQVVFNTFIARDEYERFTGVFYPDTNVVTYATNVPKKHHMSGSLIRGDYVVSACRLTNVKNVSMITKALASLGAPIKQVVIGRDRGDLNNILTIAREGNIEVTHKSLVSEEEKLSLIKNSLCLVYPQRTPYLAGLSPWESMMIGKPTICPDYKVSRDLYKDYVDYFNPNSVNSLALKIYNIFDNEYDLKRLEEASEYASVEASFDTMSDGLLRIMKSIKG